MILVNRKKWALSFINMDSMGGLNTLFTAFQDKHEYYIGVWIGKKALTLFLHKNWKEREKSIKEGE